MVSPAIRNIIITSYQMGIQNIDLLTFKIYLLKNGISYRRSMVDIYIKCHNII